MENKLKNVSPKGVLVQIAGGVTDWPERLQLVPLLQLAQPLPDLVEQVGALKAAAVAVEADHDGAEAADENGGPVHLEPLRHHLPAGRPITDRPQSFF